MTNTGNDLFQIYLYLNKMTAFYSDNFNKNGMNNMGIWQEKH